MADFNAFLPQLLKFEGGFINDPTNPGGASNKGVTLQVFAQLSQPLLNLPPTLDNLRALTTAQAGVIYKSHDWDALRGDAVDSQSVANLLVDFYIQSGPSAITVLQQTLTAMGARQIPVDGVFGDTTLLAVNASTASELFNRLRAARIAYVTDLVTQRPSLQPLLEGWLARVNSFVAPSA